MVEHINSIKVYNNVNHQIQGAVTMNNFIKLLSGIFLLVLYSFSVSADDYVKIDYPQTAPAGLKAIAITIDPPTNYYYGEMKSYGVSKENLESIISQRLTNAGFKVISFTESLENPEASVLNLKVRLIKGYGLIYSYGLNLSLNQKAPLLGGNAYHSVKTWSDWKAGGTQQTSLPVINGYVVELVDNFIETHRSQI